MNAPMITPTMIRDWTKGLDTALTGYTEAIMAGDAEGVARFSIQIEARVRDALEAAFRAAFALALSAPAAPKAPERGACEHRNRHTTQGDVLTCSDCGAVYVGWSN